MTGPVPIGLDVGTGFTKISCGGKQKSFPSLYSSRFSDGRKNVEDVAGKSTLEEAVGTRAASMGLSPKAILVRPVRHGVPHNDRGFEALAREAIRSIGANISDAYIMVGITWDARSSRKRLEKILGGISPLFHQIIPQAYGTLLDCSAKQGMVINIGHGTTEIISIQDGQPPDGISIPKAGEFVTSQLDPASNTDYEKLFAKNHSMTQKLVGLLAEHIADKATRIGHKGETILAGGGALIPGMRVSLEKALGRKVIIPEDPIFSNARGLEILAKRKAAKTAREPAGTQREHSDETGQGSTIAPDRTAPDS